MLARRSRLWPVVLLMCLPLLLAMGFGQGSDPTRIPEPKQDARVSLVDQVGNRVELTSFSLGGQSFLVGQLGKGKLAIPFEKIKSLEVNNLGGKLEGQVSLIDGTTVKLNLEPKLAATGRTVYGNYAVTLGEVTRIDFR